MLQRRGELARDLAREQGKPLAEATVEVTVATQMFKDAAEDIKRLGSEVLPSMDSNGRIQVGREPIGVVVITPWNFPMTIPSEYLSACLAVGKTVVWKPASYTPLSAQHVAECYLDADVRAGVLNLVLGHGSTIGLELVSHPAIAGIGLTGSSATGEAVARLAGTRRPLPELGGNGPATVAEDTDLHQAIPCIVRRC